MKLPRGGSHRGSSSSDPSRQVLATLDEEDSVVAIASTPNRTATSLCWRILSFWNTFAVAILTGVVTFLFLQLQYVHYQLNQQQDQLDSLQTQLTNQTHGQIQELNDAVQHEHSLTILQMAGTLTLLTCLLTMFHMSTHLRRFFEPAVQRKIITILWFSPIYSVTSFLSLVWPMVTEYLALIKDFYEAYVIYTFLSFLIAVLGKGNRELVVQTLAKHAEHLHRPTRCFQSCYHPPPDTSPSAKANAVLLECQLLAMQFVFCRPLTSIVGFIFHLLQQDDSISHDDADTSDNWTFYQTPQFYLGVITNISVFLAFRGLLKFYHAVRDDLAWCQPFSKFMAIKGIVFLTFWQQVLISIITSLKDDSDNTSTTGNHEDSSALQAAQIQNILICAEMLFFSIAHYCVFSAEEWEPGYQPIPYAKPGLGLRDFASDMSVILSTSAEARSYRRDQQRQPSLSPTVSTLEGDASLASLSQDA